MTVQMHRSKAARCNLSYILTAQRNGLGNSPTLAKKTLHKAGGEAAGRLRSLGRASRLGQAGLGPRRFGSALPLQPDSPGGSSLRLGPPHPAPRAPRSCATNLTSESTPELQPAQVQPSGSSTGLRLLNPSSSLLR